MTITPPTLRGLWRDDDDARAVYSEAAGIHRIVPRAVAIPADANDVVTLVRWAAEHRVPLTPRGSGSSMGGGAVGAGVVVDLNRLHLHSRVDAVSATFAVSASALCGDVDSIARREGLRFPVDPSSARFCTVGGMAATNAAGARTLRFGQMNAWVHGLECVFADGSRAWVRRGDPLPDLPVIDRVAKLAASLRDMERVAPSRHSGVRKESSGYALATWSESESLVDLLVGSEGTLAIFVAVELRLAPVPPASATMLASFPSIEAAAAAAAVAAELNAAACELLDRTFLDIARRGSAIPVPEAANAVLLVEIEEGSEERLDQVMTALSGAFHAAGALQVEQALDTAHAARLWHLRHAASPILAALSRATISMQVVEDGAVPPAKLAEYVHGLHTMLAKHDFSGVIFGHAGDGHVHANVLVDVSQPDWRERLGRVFDEGVDLVASLGGTLTGEHGDGRLRAGAVSRIWPESTVARFREVKAAFDPAGILNPGVKLPSPDAPRFGAPIKYDPMLEPLPPIARSALDRVQRERIWNRSRIELLDEESRA